MSFSNQHSAIKAHNKEEIAMSTSIRKTVYGGAVATLGACALMAPVAFGKTTHKVTMKSHGACSSATATHVCGTFTGTPFGKCKMTGTLVIPKTIQTWKCKGGSFRVTGTGTSGASNDAKGNWVLSKGTGKYKGIKGKGTFTGKISTSVFTYKGKASY
jgi:hypothetical protein